MNDPLSLRQHWPEPARRRPIVIFGAGSITRDAHLPAYAKGGYDIAGIYDPDRKKAAELGLPVFASIEDAARRRSQDRTEVRTAPASARSTVSAAAPAAPSAANHVGHQTTYQ